MMGKSKGILHGRSQLMVPLIALSALIVFNLIRDVSFFSIRVLTNSDGNAVLSGKLITLLSSASELAILAMGMTLVTAVSRGQDISVGAGAAIAGSVFVSVLRSGDITWGAIVIAFLASCGVAMIFGAFNGTLVAVFKIQPMIATLILFTTGRSIAYWINGGATPTITNDLLKSIGNFIPGIPVPTPIFVVILCGILFSLMLKFTNLSLYAQSVGINEKASRLNGINPVLMRIVTFVILGICVAFAATISVSRMGLINHETILLGIEMEAILAVAIGGNSLGGGKFSMVGSVIGAYVIQGLRTTLLAMKVAPTDVKVYYAVVVIVIMVMGSAVVKEKAGQLWSKLFVKKAVPAG
jgi:simple sugar transport system permease protein